MNKREAQNTPTWALLDQTKWWVIGTSDVVKRRGMTLKHKANTVAWLVRHADDLVAAMAFPLSGAWLSAPDEVVGEWEFAMSNPEVWVLTQPLVRAMLEDLLEARV